MQNSLEVQKFLPLVTQVICLLAKRWPYWKGRTTILRLIRASLKGSKPLVITGLKDSNTKLAVPWDDFCGSTAVAFGEIDGDLYRFICIAINETESRRKIFVDIGANLGGFTLRVAAKFNIPCVAYEPQVNLANLLIYNAEVNSIEDKVEVRTKALGNVSDEARMIISAQNCGNSRIDSNNQSGVIVELRRLDDEFGIEEWRHISVLKVDVEGFELEVFKGASQLFSYYRPTIAFEVNTVELQEFKLKPRHIADFLRSVGYTQFYALEKRLYPVENGMFIVSNVVAVGNDGERIVRKFGLDLEYRPQPKKMWPVIYYDF